MKSGCKCKDTDMYWHFTSNKCLCKPTMYLSPLGCRECPEGSRPAQDRSKCICFNPNFIWNSFTNKCACDPLSRMELTDPLDPATWTNKCLRCPTTAFASRD
jgi:hypothetical protein